MQGRDGGQRELLDVDALVGHLLPVGSAFKFLAERRHELFPDDVFEDLFASDRGRPSVPADVIASVMVLQALHSLRTGKRRTLSRLICGGRRRAGSR